MAARTVPEHRQIVTPILLTNVDDWTIEGVARRHSAEQGRRGCDTPG
jgi:hypothetical protein